MSDTVFTPEMDWGDINDNYGGPQSPLYIKAPTKVNGVEGKWLSIVSPLESTDATTFYAANTHSFWKQYNVDRIDEGLDILLRYQERTRTNTLRCRGLLDQDPTQSIVDLLTPRALLGDRLNGGTSYGPSLEESTNRYMN